MTRQNPRGGEPQLCTSEQVSERAPLRNRTGDLLLTMSILGPVSTVVMLVSAGLFVVLVPLNVPDFCSVLARGWHRGGRDWPSTAA